MSKFFKVTEETKATKWIKDFGCIGIAINNLREEPEVTVAEDGGIWSAEERPVRINPFKKDGDSRTVEINLYMPTQDLSDRIRVLPRVHKTLNGLMKNSGLKREMTEEEVEFLDNLYFDCFIDEDGE